MRKIFITITEPAPYGGLSSDDEVFRGTSEAFAETFGISKRLAAQEKGQTTDGFRTMYWEPAL